MKKCLLKIVMLFLAVSGVVGSLSAAQQPAQRPDDWRRWNISQKNLAHVQNALVAFSIVAGELAISDILCPYPVGNSYVKDTSFYATFVKHSNFIEPKTKAYICLGSFCLWLMSCFITPNPKIGKVAVISGDLRDFSNCIPVIAGSIDKGKCFKIQQYKGKCATYLLFTMDIMPGQEGESLDDIYKDMWKEYIIEWVNNGRKTDTQFVLTEQGKKTIKSIEESARKLEANIPEALSTLIYEYSQSCLQNNVNSLKEQQVCPKKLSTKQDLQDCPPISTEVCVVDDKGRPIKVKEGDVLDYDLIRWKNTSLTDDAKKLFINDGVIGDDWGFGYGVLQYIRLGESPLLKEDFLKGQPTFKNRDSIIYPVQKNGRWLSMKMLT